MHQLARLGQRLAELQHPVELLRVPAGPPVRVVEVLAAAGVVGADRLQVPVGVRRDPDVGPRRRDDQVADPLGVLLGQSRAVLVEVDEAAPGPAPGPAGLVGRGATKPDHDDEVAIRRPPQTPSAAAEQPRPRAGCARRSRRRRRPCVGVGLRVGRRPVGGGGSSAAAIASASVGGQPHPEHVAELALGAQVDPVVGADRDPLALLLRRQLERVQLLVGGERVDRRARVAAHDVVPPVGEERPVRGEA